MKPNRAAYTALIAGALFLALSCRDAGPLGVTPTAPPAADLTTSLLHIGLVRCTPLPEDAVSETIGPEGGVITVGPHTLSIPPGALAEPVTITAVAPSDTVNRIVFGPEGLVFQQAPRLTMSYANCRGLGLIVPKHIALTTDLLQILELLQSIDNIFARTVSARIQHFSTYAVAW
jgi:hypothetical protein